MNFCGQLLSVLYEVSLKGDLLQGMESTFSHCVQIIRIYHKCEGKIEKSVLRIGVLHHEACWAMTNGDPQGRIFLSYPNTKKNGLIFLLTTVLILK